MYDLMLTALITTTGATTDLECELLEGKLIIVINEAETITDTLVTLSTIFF